jgi:translation initiation factor IF-2
MNVSELSRQVRVPTTKLLEILPGLGFDIGKRAIKVDDRVAREIIRKLSDPRIRESIFPNKEREEAKVESIKQTDGKRKVIEIGDSITVKDFAEKMGLQVTKLILALMKNGVMAGINERIDFDTASIMAVDFGYEIKKQDSVETINWEKEKEERAKFFLDDPKNLKPRPPVVVVMGHVDHGKTKLLDAIRETDVVSGEAGGITQHIGAYQVVKNNQQITFIDTPGHEAFSAMRSRGASVADIAILVVAADDGVQPQTIEAISHIRSAGLPFVVAINKIDKPEANVDKIKNELSEIGLASEDWGGKTICVEISAKEKINIDGLLDTLLLVYEMEKDKIQGNENRVAVGTIIESHIDKGMGAVATCIIQTGTLSPGDVVRIGGGVSKIRALKDWKGREIKNAGPSMPALILGLKTVPVVGDILSEVSDKKEIRQLIKSVDKSKYRLMKQTTNELTIKNEDENGEDIKKIKLILKADMLGSVEAIREALFKISKKDVFVEIVKQGLGNINEGDVEQAKNLGAYILGFNNKIIPQAEVVASELNVDIKISKIIYELLDFVAEKVKELSNPEIVVKNLGKARVIKIFRTEKKSQIVGANVLDGKILPDSNIKIFRNESLIGEARAVRLQCGKESVNEAVFGEECGVLVDGLNEIKEGDILEFYKVEMK